MISILTLMENQESENQALHSEPGLSFLVTAGGLRFLFDCGPGPATISNAHRLGVDLRSVDFTVCSHSHYDHAAGFRDMAENGLGGKVLYTGPNFLERKYQISPNGLKYSDVSAGFDGEFLREHGVEHRVCSGLTELAEGCWLVGDFPRVSGFETTPEEFVTGTPPSVRRDDFSDEICLALQTAKGLVVLVGCSHPGIVNMTRRVHEVLRQPIYAVLGGTHLADADEYRVEKTVAEMTAMGVSVLGFCHCSGALVEKLLASDRRVQECHLAPGDCFTAV